MTKYVKPSTRYLSLLVFGAVCWYMLSAALDVPTRELQANTLSTLYATAALLVLAVVFCPLFRPSLQINRTDLLAAILFAGVTLARFCHAGPAGAVRYDEVLQAAMLYAALRIIYTAERRTMTVLLMLLCGFGICEAWTGIRQIYGFACSNHSLFRVTGTFFNPGPYAGFVAVAGICGVACIVRRQNLAARVFRSWSVLRRQRPAVLILGVAPYLLGWGAAILAAVVLPSTMSRAGLIAAIAGCVALLLREFGFGRRLRRACRVNPLRTVLFSAIALFLLGGAATGAYFLKRPSADGRLLMWKIDARIMLRHPLCGVGPGNFAGAFGKEQAAYFAAKERPEKETQVAGCPESGFNEYLQFGAETGIGGFVLLLLMTGTALLNLIRRGNPLGYGLLAAAVFACFSYPWSVLPLRLLFVLLLAATQARPAVRIRKGRLITLVALLLTGCFAAWPGLYRRSELRVNASRQWNDVRIWVSAERYDYAAEDGGRYLNAMRWDFRFLYDYGYSLHKTGDYRRSNEILALGMQISSDPMFWNITGRNCEALGDFEAAERAYLHAHDMVPDRIYPLYLLAKLYFSTGQTAKARAAADRVIAHRPKIESVQTREMQAELHELTNTPNNPDRSCDES
ncbi:O-antigen ligase family protein [uncultured Alistipes sp.]|jgi:O-antigen ligase|uniref:O-antigen ligase family protein n=1 Tax=uncultured Alistipes sp. TaxID=538949 RepID=UPI0025E88647|nr:O-antigen ligase family protein [uncultured Alistipes sp.]